MGIEISNAEAGLSIRSTESSSEKSRKYPTIAQLVELFKADVYPSYSYVSQERSTYCLKAFAVFAGERKLGPSLISEHWKAFEQEYDSPRTRLHHRCHLARFLKWCLKHGYTKADLQEWLPSGSYHAPSFYKKITEPEYERIKTAVMGSTWYGVVVLSYRTGIRCGALSTLMWGAVNQRDRTISFMPPNSKKWTTVPYTAGGDVDQVIRAMWAARINHYVFPELANRHLRYKNNPKSNSVSCAFHHYLKWAGIKEYSWADICKSYDGSTQVQVNSSDHVGGEEGIIGPGTGV